MSSRSEDRWDLVPYERAGPLECGHRLSDLIALLGEKPRRGPNPGTPDLYQFRTFDILVTVGSDGVAATVSIGRQSPVKPYYEDIA